MDGSVGGTGRHTDTRMACWDGGIKTVWMVWTDR